MYVNKVGISVGGGVGWGREGRGEGEGEEGDLSHSLSEDCVTDPKGAYPHA